MRLYLNKFLALLVILAINTSYANSFFVEYKVSTAGIKIGNFSWFLDIDDKFYQTEIDLKNSGIFSPLYKFEGKYLSYGIIEDKIFKAKKYNQFWTTKKKTKIVKMSFDDYLIDLTQEPAENEFARVSLEELYLYYDPITSFINILNGKNEAKTIDGRRIYTLKRNEKKNEKIVLKIEDYVNIWADHKRNDLKKIEFFIQDDLLPNKILIHFKERVFKLEKI